MASVAELLPRAARLKYELEVQLRAVEQGNGDAGDCGMGLRELFTQINTLRQLLNAERPERRNLWKVKIDELGHEAQFLSNDLRRVTNFHQHQRERDSLFRRRAGAAPSSAHDDLLEAEDSYARSGNQVDRGVLSLRIDADGCLPVPHGRGDGVWRPSVTPSPFVRRPRRQRARHRGAPVTFRSDTRVAAMACRRDGVEVVEKSPARHRRDDAPPRPHERATQVDELMETGRASLDSLRAQRERLKNTHRNALDMINKLGLSDTVMKLINSRNRQDRKIVVGGFVFLFVLFYLCMRWRG